MTAALAAWITATISLSGYGGLVLLMGIESACTPLPSEVIMPFAGYLASTGRFSLSLAALAGALGCNLGSAVAYAVGARGGRPFVARYGRYVLLDLGDLARAEWFFDRFGGPAVFFARMLPVVRAFIALPAGMARMRLVPFHLYTFVGSFIWCFALAYVGDKLGARWSNDPRLQAILHQFDALILAVVVLGGAWFVWTRLRRSA